LISKDEDPAQTADGQPETDPSAEPAADPSAEPAADPSAQEDQSADAEGTAAGSGTEETAALPPDEAGPAVLASLANRLGRVEGQLAEYHRRAAHRESVIDHLHEQNQRLHGGIGRAILEPVVTDLIRLYDQLDREVRRLDADGQDARLLWSFAEDVAQILDRCGVERFSAKPGDPVERDRHRPLGVVACDDESRHNTVAAVVAVGFYERDTGRIRRPVQARFYQYAPGEADQTPDAPLSQ